MGMSFGRVGSRLRHIVEQQAYVRAGKRIDALDLLCSGFMPDGHS